VVHKIGVKNQNKPSKNKGHHKEKTGIVGENQVSPESRHNPSNPHRGAEKACKWGGALQPLEYLGFSKC